MKTIKEIFKQKTELILVLKAAFVVTFCDRYYLKKVNDNQFLGDYMSRYRGPKNRIARKFGANIFGRARNPLIHKQNPPGMHGARRRKKSDYGMQLEEKQKLKAVYGMITEKQLVIYYKHAVKKGNVAQKLLELLECRLDNIVYRLKLAPTIFAAHQLVSHGHILVNGEKVDRRSFQVRPEMVVSVKEKSRNIPIVLTARQNTHITIPEYCSIDEKNYSGQIEVFPHPDQISLPIPINTAVICDFLAHTK